MCDFKANAVTSSFVAHPSIMNIIVLLGINCKAAQLIAQS